MKRAIIGIFTVIAMVGLVAATLAWGSDPGTITATPDAASAFDKFIQPFMTATVGTLISLLCAYGVKFLKAKTGIAISDETEQFIEKTANQAVMFVEEKSAAAVKDGLSKWPSAVKLRTAVDAITSKIPGITEDHAEEVVHYVLAKIPALGASGNVWDTPITGTTTLQTSTATTPAPENLKTTIESMASDALSALLSQLAAKVAPTTKAA